MSIKPIAAPKLYQRIAQEIEDLIVNGTFRVGERLPAERNLARSLNVSRSSLREALSDLEYRGHLEIKIGSGAYVKKVEPSAVVGSRQDSAISHFDVLRARQLIEGEAAALAARNASPAQVQAIESAFDRLAADRQVQVPSAADREFHLLIAQACGSTALLMVIERLWIATSQPLSDRMMNMYVTKPRKRDNVWEHLAVLEGIRDGKPIAARRAMRQHLINAEKQLLVSLGGDRRERGRQKGKP